METATTHGKPSVAVLVITWNGGETVHRCLESLLQLYYPNYRICLVDNGSKPGFSDSLSATFPDVHVLALPSNLGYAGGCNAGLTWARTQGVDHVLLLNDDTTVDPALLNVLVERSAQLNDRALLAPKILFSDRTDVIWSAGGRLRPIWFKADNIGIGHSASHFDEPRQVEWASGCALFAPISVVNTVGELDERYFLYLEDVEWCLRMRRCGIQIWYEPKALLWHEVSASVKTIDERIVRYYSYRNYYLLAFTHTGIAGRLWFGLHFIVTSLKIAARSVFFPSYRRNPWYHARTRAMADLVRRRFGKAPYPDDSIRVTQSAQVI